MIDFTPFLPPSRGGRLNRWVGAAEAIAAVPEGARIFIGGGALVPSVLLQELDDQRDRYTRLDVVTAGLTRRPAILEHPGRPFWFVTTHATPAFRRLWDTGTVDILPARYSDLARIFAPDGPLPADVAIVQTSAPGPDGRVSLGPSVGVNAHVVRTAPLVIAQVNPKVPYTFGAGELSTDEIDYLVRVEGDIPVRRPVEDRGDRDDVSAEVARLAARVRPRRLDDPVRRRDDPRRHPRQPVDPPGPARPLRPHQRGLHRPLRGRRHRGHDGLGGGAHHAPAAGVDGPQPGGGDGPGAPTRTGPG